MRLLLIATLVAPLAACSFLPVRFSTSRAGSHESTPSSAADAADGTSSPESLRALWKDFDRLVPCDEGPRACVPELAKVVGVTSFTKERVWNPAAVMSTPDETWLPGWETLPKFEDDYGSSARHTFEAIWLAGHYRRAKARCVADAAAKIADAKKQDAATRDRIASARSKSGIYEQLAALVSLRSPLPPDDLEAERWRTWAGGPFEVESAIAGLFAEPSRAPAYLPIAAPDPRARPFLRPRGDDALETDAICAFSAHQRWDLRGHERAVREPYTAAEKNNLSERLKASGASLSALWKEPTNIPELTAIDFDTQNDPYSAPGTMVRVGGQPGEIRVAGSHYVTLEVAAVRKDGNATLVIAKQEHDTSFVLGCTVARDRLIISNGVVQNDQSCRYGTAWGRRLLTVRFSELPPGGVQKEDRIAFFATVVDKKETRTEKPGSRVREQTLGMTGAVLYYVGRGNAVSYEVPRR